MEQSTIYIKDFHQNHSNWVGQSSLTMKITELFAEKKLGSQFLFPKSIQEETQGRIDWQNYLIISIPGTTKDEMKLKQKLHLFYQVILKAFIVQ